MKRCSFCEWIPILPMPVWPLAGQCALGQNVVVGSMALLLAVRGNIATRSMSGPPCALQLHRTTVWCGATVDIKYPEYSSIDADEFYLLDLRILDNCLKSTHGVDEVYALAADMGGMGYISTHNAEILC